MFSLKILAAQNNSFHSIQYMTAMLEVISDSFQCQENIFTCGISLLFASSSVTIHLVSHASRMMFKKSIQR